METCRPIPLFLLFLQSIILFCNSVNAKLSPLFPAFINAGLEQSSDSGRGLYETRYFTQILDHFDFTPQSYGTFQQRYLVNDTHWGGKGAPIFVYTGNEGDIGWFAHNTGFMYEIAPHFEALLVFIESESENCYEVIKNSWKEIEDTATQTGGLDKIEKSFKLCKGEGQGVEGWISTAIIYAAMTDYPTVSNFLALLPAYPVKQMCKAIDNPMAGNDTFARLYGAMNIYYNYSGTERCFVTGDWDEHGKVGGWAWQSCTEIILTAGARNNESIFPPSTYNYTERAMKCQNYYGVAPRPHWITTEFGGHDIRRVLKRFGSNIIFFNGLRDPWSGGGILKSLSKSLIAMVAPEGAHHVDLRFSRKEDPKWLKTVRMKEAKIISKWLEQYYSDRRST